MLFLAVIHRTTPKNNKKNFSASELASHDLKGVEHGLKQQKAKLEETKAQVEKLEGVSGGAKERVKEIESMAANTAKIEKGTTVAALLAG